MPVLAGLFKSVDVELQCKSLSDCTTPFFYYRYCPCCFWTTGRKFLWSSRAERDALALLLRSSATRHLGPIGLYAVRGCIPTQGLMAW